MAKHFDLSITDRLQLHPRPPQHRRRSRARRHLRGPHQPAGRAVRAAATVRAYKSLGGVEHAFRSLKTVDLELRPVFHWTAPRVRAHVLLCMLAYYLEWHMRQAWPRYCSTSTTRRHATRNHLAGGQSRALTGGAAQGRQQTHRSAEGEPLPVHSFHTLLADLATLTRNVVRLGHDRLTAILATPTRTQHRALDLLGVVPTA